MQDLNKSRVLFVDDDIFIMQPCIEALRDDGYLVVACASADEALALARNAAFDLVVLDIMMHPGKSFSTLETAGGYKTGIALARELRSMMPDSKFLAFTVSGDPEIEEWFTSDESVGFLRKPASPSQLVKIVSRLLRQDRDSVHAFIVHGRDSNLLREVREFFNKRPAFPKPVILAEQPSRGLTLIEKFEYYANESDLAIVLLTPDDLGHLVERADQVLARPRMNVVFELGYFLGALRRCSGRVILLKKGEMEFPSDLNGIVYIDVTEGVEKSGETIERELAHWL